MKWLIEIPFDFFIGALAFLLIPKLVKGIRVESFKSAITLVLFMSISNFFLQLFFGWLLFPLSFLTLGLARFILNGIILDVGSDVVKGVKVDSFKSAILGSVVLSVIWTVLLFISKNLLGF